LAKQQLPLIELREELRREREANEKLTAELKRQDEIILKHEDNKKSL